MMMSRPILLLLPLAAGAAVVAGCSTPPPPPPIVQVGSGLSVAFSSTPSPPHTGDDVILLRLTDSTSNAPVGDANIQVQAESVSPRIPGSTVSGRAQGNGMYQAPVVLPIPTGYDVRVQITRPGQPAATFTFHVDVEH